MGRDRPAAVRVGAAAPGNRDLLAGTGTPASFFVLGEAIAGREGLLRRMIGQGCAVEVHSWHHLRMPDQSTKDMMRDIDRTRELIGTVTGRAPRYLRPPEGAVSRRVLAGIAETGLVPVFWSVQAMDWTEPGTELIRERIIAGLSDGAIVLLHDAGGDRSQTIAAVPAIIDAIHERGLRPVSLIDLPVPRPDPSPAALGLG